VLALVLCGTGCAPSPPAPDGLVVTIEPLAKIIQPLLPPGMPLHRLLPPNASAHTYEPSVRDAQTVASSRILFYVDESLDGWAADLSAPKRIPVSSFLPDAARRGIELDGDHDHGDHAHDHDHPEGAFNPHFWTAPLSVAEVVPGLANALAEADPANAAHYRAKGEEFVASMRTLDAELTEILAPVRGAAVAQFHPSWDYFLARYGLRVVGLVEPAPGKEGSPRYLEGLIAKLRAAEVRIVFTEPQLPIRPAEVVAEAIGAKLLSMDPVGGNIPGQDSYRDWLLYSARELRAAL
jgi:ABC-type Zn uptake system ZnuABC Zn-binding protein ZnuA